MEKLQFIENPLNDISRALCKIIYNKSFYKDPVNIILHGLKNKKYYKFIRMVYVLTALKRYDDAALLFVYKHAALTNHIYDYKYFYNGKLPGLYINDISKKTIAEYKKKFDSLYRQISECKYEYNNSNCNMNINHYIIPEIKKKIASVFKSYTELYKLQQGNCKKEFLYLFKMDCNIHHRTGLMLIKPKFA